MVSSQRYPSFCLCRRNKILAILPLELPTAAAGSKQRFAAPCRAPEPPRIQYWVFLNSQSVCQLSDKLT